ncbi:hypothetical protein ACU686_01410 [Yinghuangia aomiensis]
MAERGAQQRRGAAVARRRVGTIGIHTGKRRAGCGAAGGGPPRAALLAEDPVPISGV